MLRLGAHESIAGGLYRAYERGQKVGCEALQIWVKNGRQWDAPPLQPEEIRRFREARCETGIHPVVAHAAYIINLASPKAELRRRSIAALRLEVERCAALDVPYLVLHPGAHTGAGEEAGLRFIAASLRRVIAETPEAPVCILLETMAGAGTKLGCTFEQLAYLLAEVGDDQRLGVCFDTCHVFAAGYELRTPEGYAETMAAFDKVIGLPHLHVVHLNDSKHPRGSHKDRHAHIGEGELGLAGFRNVLQDARLEGLPGLLETPKSDDLHEDVENLRRLRALAAGEVDEVEIQLEALE
ncbi:MAG: deoxyribonuclease IV [Anaerolineae bacterium]